MNADGQNQLDATKSKSNKEKDVAGFSGCFQAIMVVLALLALLIYLVFYGLGGAMFG